MKFAKIALLVVLTFVCMGVMFVDAKPFRPPSIALTDIWLGDAGSGQTYIYASGTYDRGDPAATIVRIEFDWRWVRDPSVGSYQNVPPEDWGGGAWEWHTVPLPDGSGNWEVRARLWYDAGQGVTNTDWVQETIP